ncbi:OsmC family protein [Nibrella saemangeumensis]|uniref:OsmC family protein n=1 Tax=Nibrella saemangeumensis TaxID=1084526 RepID=A0ABP8NB60_9BACT
MNMKVYEGFFFEASGNWQQGLEGSGHIMTTSFESPIGAPVSMGGKGVGTNPEDLMVAAAASCQLLTLAAIMQFNKIPFNNITITSRGAFRFTKAGPELTRIEHCPEIWLNQEEYDRSAATIKKFFSLAEKSCLVSKAIQNNVEVVVKGCIQYE